MEQLLWFEQPTQVKIFDGVDVDGDFNFCWGIAYKDTVICACCGGVLSTATVYTNAQLDGYTGAALIPYEDWADFSESIRE